MKKTLTLVCVFALLFTAACSSAPLSETLKEEPVVPLEERTATPAVRQTSQTAPSHHTLEEIGVVKKYIQLGEERNQLIKEYSKIHYGRAMVNIDPKAVVVHWTVSSDWESVYNYFYPVVGNDDEGGRLNVSSQFLVARDGTIFQLTPELLLNRHAIGLNWCAFGIENVGGVGGEEDLTDAQLQANIKLIRQLKKMYPSITNVLGHYQQIYAKNTPLWREDMADYYADKVDPGPIFMRHLRQTLSPEGLQFFPE